MKVYRQLGRREFTSTSALSSAHAHTHVDHSAKMFSAVYHSEEPTAAFREETHVHTLTLTHSHTHTHKGQAALQGGPCLLSVRVKVSQPKLRQASLTHMHTHTPLDV